MIEDALAIMDHLAARVTASAAAGMGCGAAYATFKGFPLVKTSATTALSCALVSTACFGMERLAHVAISQSAKLLDDGNGKSIPIPPSGENSSMLLQSPINLKHHYGSHALGGFFGGAVVGFLFQGKPIAGAYLLTPIMLGIGFAEVSLDEYRTKRMRQLIEQERESS